MFFVRKLRKSEFVFIVLLIGMICFPARVFAGDTELVTTIEPKSLHLISGKSIIHRSAEPLTRISIASPEIADFTLLSPYEVYITGKSAGTTNMILWKENKVADIFDLEVSYDISQLKQKLNEVLPQEKELRVMATNDSITLSGKVSNTADLSQALSLAKAFAPKEKIHNLVQVGGVHQVMLEVRVAEIARSTVKRLGINFNYARGSEFGITTLAGLSQVVLPTEATLGTSPLGMIKSSYVNALFRFNRNSATWTGLIDALKEDGLVKILAEPTLIALSGQKAKFLAGGEFPVPVPQGLGTVAIEYRPFGVSLAFTPTVVDGNRINLQVEPEVSELDFTSGVQLEGVVVPGLTKRKALTNIELKDGQSFAIAGLLKNSIRDTVSKFPVLGDVPVLGALFRSRAFLKNETELVIIATPYLVKPYDRKKQILPTDFYVEPNDTEIYLLGLLEARKKKETVSIRGEFEGEFGHIIQKTF
jgi:pilus assembly protein CpaC